MLDRLGYALAEIRENYDRPTWWQSRAAARLVGPLQSALGPATGFRVLDGDWDTLLVLDGCRADLFEEVADVSAYDAYDRVYSAGSATNEWTTANFDGQARTDCVYVTGNPVVSRNVSTAFHAFLEPWRDGFDPDLGTVPPDHVTEAALAARDRHPDKRLVVHYLQPHYPFLGAPDLRYGEFARTDDVTVDDAKAGASDVWEALGLGFERREEVWAAYADNLRVVLDAIQPMLEAPGRTVITSDHGNLLGERLSPIPLRVYGHPPGVHHRALREVPWAVVGDEASGDDRSGGETADGEPSDGDRRVDADVQRQLESLGYA